MQKVLSCANQLKPIPNFLLNHSQFAKSYIEVLDPMELSLQDDEYASIFILLHETIPLDCTTCERWSLISSVYFVFFIKKKQVPKVSRTSVSIFISIPLINLSAFIPILGYVIAVVL